MARVQSIAHPRSTADRNDIFLHMHATGPQTELASMVRWDLPGKERHAAQCYDEGGGHQRQIERIQSTSPTLQKTVCEPTKECIFTKKYSKMLECDVVWHNVLSAGPDLVV